MARANRHFIPGYIWHITHRCHKRSFLLKFSKDKEISVAIPKDNKPPVIHYPPMQFHKFSTGPFQAGVENHEIDGVTVKVYSPEKTLADCFKFRNKIGMDVVLEALKLYKSRMKFDHKKILAYARICRVDKIVLLYLEANI